MLNSCRTRVMISAMMVAMQARTRKRSRTGCWCFCRWRRRSRSSPGIAIYGVVNPSKAKPNPNAPGFRGSLVWGDGIFANRAQLKAWLKLHGASYEDWVKQHPAALKLVKPPVKHKVAVTHKPREVAQAGRAQDRTPVRRPARRRSHGEPELVAPHS